MASTAAQRKWRDKNRFVKRQLNVMARTITHDGLNEIAAKFDLRGKAEAVAFGVYVVRRSVEGGFQARPRRLFTVSGLGHNVVWIRCLPRSRNCCARSLIARS